MLMVLFAPTSNLLSANVGALAKGSLFFDAP
jgi:hypothetical protein